MVPPAKSSISVREQLPATVASVAVARRVMRRFAGDLDVDLDGMVLAVSEAVANAVIHAYDDGDGGTIELTASASPHEVAVVVRDHGRGIGGRSGDVAGAGYGIEIIRRLAQHVTVHDSSAGVVLTMRFCRGGPWSAR